MKEKLDDKGKVGTKMPKPAYGNKGGMSEEMGRKSSADRANKGVKAGRSSGKRGR